MEHLPWIKPSLTGPTEELLETHQMTREFHEEIHYRQEFERYCDWYHATARQHRREFNKLQMDFNVLGWFYGR